MRCHAPSQHAGFYTSTFFSLVPCLGNRSSTLGESSKETRRRAPHRTVFVWSRSRLAVSLHLWLRLALFLHDEVAIASPNPLVHGRNTNCPWFYLLRSPTELQGPGKNGCRKARADANFSPARSWPCRSPHRTSPSPPGAERLQRGARPRLFFFSLLLGLAELPPRALCWRGRV